MDPADLLDPTEVAEVLRLGSRNPVAVYARRHDDFPRPVVNKADGHTKLWLRSDVEAWRRRHRAAVSRRRTHEPMSHLISTVLPSSG